MIELIERKRKMVNLKVIVEKNLVKLPEFDRKILTLSFIDGVTNIRISQIIGCSLRTLFRRKRKALDAYMNELSKDGFDKNYFIREYSCERWFVSVFEECVAKENILDDCIDRRMIRKVIGDVTNINIPYRESNTCR